MKKKSEFPKALLDSIVEKFVIIDEFTKPNYPLEYKIAKQLLKTYGAEFLNQYNLNFKIRSLLWFLGKGRAEIKKQYNLFLLTKQKESPILEDKPVIEIEKINKKPSKLTEFLDLDYE